MDNEFVTTPVDDAFMVDDASLIDDAYVGNKGGLWQEKESQFETNDTPAFLPGTETSAHHGHHHNTGVGVAKSPVNRIYFAKLALYAVETIVLVAFIVSCYRMCRSRRRQQKKKLKPWTNEIHFKDECESTDDSMDSAENGQHDRNYPIDRNDWLASVGFEGKDEGNPNPFVFAEKAMSDSSSSSYGGDDDNDIALFNALNGDSSTASQSAASSLNQNTPPRSPRMTLDNPPLPLQGSPTDLLGSGLGSSPPTVSELFQNTISSHWRMAPPISLGGEGSNGSLDEEMATIRNELMQ